MPEISPPLAAAYVVSEANDIAIILDEPLPGAPVLLEVVAGQARLHLGAPGGKSVLLHRPSDQTLALLGGLHDAVVLAAGVEFVVPVRA